MALLLDNYMGYASMTVYDDDKHAVQAIPHVSEREVVQLFHRFPTRAAVFLMDLPMRSTPGLLKARSFCDFSSSRERRVIRSGSYPTEDLVGGQFWEDQLDSLWRQSVDTDEVASRQDDVAWGEPALASILPIVGSRTTVTIETAAERAQWELREEHRQNEDLNQKARKPRAQKRAQTELAFSQLLASAVRFCEMHGDPGIFASEALQVVVAYKWELVVYRIFAAKFILFIIYCIGLWFLGLYFQQWREDSYLAVRIGAWVLWGFVAIQTALQLKNELGQFRGEINAAAGVTFCRRLRRAAASYLSDKWNYIDAIAILATSAALVVMVVGHPDQRTQISSRRVLRLAAEGQSLAGSPAEAQENYNSSDTSLDPDESYTLEHLLALAVFMDGLKVLYYLRGFQSTAFLVNMLEQILLDMRGFVFVYLVIAVSVAYSFHVLYRSYSEDAGFATIGDSVLTVLIFALGEVPAETVNSGPNATLGVILLLLCMLLLPVVLLNALIALMGDTYSKVQANKTAANMLERTAVILEIEASMRCQDEPSLSSCCTCCLGHDSAWAPVVLALLTLPVPISENPVFLHVRTTTVGRAGPR
eukprot:COSAG01_NODE_2366_length_7816_cov_3.797460_11_plen_590_part_00